MSESENPTTLGYKKIIEIVTKPQINKKGQVVKQGKKYFCESMQEKEIFSRNNPGIEMEIYPVELPVFVADRYLEENKKHFTRKEEPLQTLQEPKSNPAFWREQAKQLGIPMYRRTKEEVLADIAKQTTTSTC